MSKEKLKKLERITFYVMLALLLLTIAALLLHLKEVIGIGLSGFFALAALICSAVHRACVNRITGKTVFGKKLGEKKKKKSK
ncbi:MAG: hypothetical protein IKT90_03370 [Clostridia bacterium]|nr:hypothetical protein [Clostridia bacterium]